MLRQQQKIYQPHRYNWPRLTAIFAQAFLMIFIGSSTILAKHFSHEVVLTKKGIYKAELQSDIQLHSIALPPHTPLENILVKPGEKVLRGQVIARIDAEETSKAIAIVEAELHSSLVERRCILNPEGFQASDIALENDFALNRASHNCLSALAHFDNRETTLLARKSSLMKQRNATFQKALQWGALAQLQGRKRLNSNSIENLVEFQLDIINTDILINEIEREIVLLDRDRKSEISSRIDDLTLSILSKELILERLAHLERNPTITTNEGGTIVQVRQAEVNPTYGHQSPFVDIESNSQRIGLVLRLQNNQQAEFLVGDPVVITFSSPQADHASRFNGYISFLDETDRHRGIITAQISRLNNSPYWPNKYLTENSDIELITNPQPENLGSAIDRNLILSIEN